jgi:hypothetical protein
MIITSVWKVMVMTYLKVFRSVNVKSFWQTTKTQSAYLVTEPKLDQAAYCMQIWHMLHGLALHAWHFTFAASPVVLCYFAPMRD